jgi:hypothetical protein
MQQALVIRILLTLVAVGCTAHTIFFVHSGHFSFDWRVYDAHTIILEPRRDVQANGVRRGDRLDLQHQNLATRASLYVTTMPGETYTLALQRNGERLQIPVSRNPPLNPDPDYLNALFLALVLALGLVTLWWGRDWTAWGLSLFAIAFLVNNFLFLPLPPIAAFATTLVNWTVIAPLATLGLYAMALALSGAVLIPPIRRLFHAVLAVILLANLVLLNAQAVAFVVFGDTRLLQYGLSSIILYVVSIFIPLVVLLTAYPRADPERQLRLRWVIFSLALFLGPLAWSNLILRGGAAPFVWWTAILCGVSGLLYAVLRKRVVAMSFAVNRALVFAVIAAFVIGIFALLGIVVEETALGRDEGLALTLGVSLIIGLVLEALRDRINSVIERLFFRRRFSAENALRRFARQCAYITCRNRLLDEAVEEIHQHIQPGALAFYEETDDGYLRVRQGGEPTFPERVDIDDRTFVQLRAETDELDLGDVKSELGGEGYAYPMAVRGALRGAVVCGARTEAYTKDERDLIAHVAHQVGLALHALHARDNEIFIANLASGVVEPSDARMHARDLHSKWAYK